MAAAVPARAASSSDLRRVERVAAGRVDQHRRGIRPPRQGAAERDRVAGDDQVDAQQPGEGGQLLRGAGALAVGGDHHRQRAGQHQAGGEPGHGQRLAGAGRAGQQQRRGVGGERQAVERQGGGERGGQRAGLQGGMQARRARRGIAARRARGR